ncbi:MAG TPA: diaminopimelate epimerase [Caldimonas sp.]|jgi:diaminopimelate epimerase|nr:diaminopimelate epimerase [Caldimonas sp.]HEX2540387.1 diaminopimelate epimerase [Caldimonas sp.]
MRVRFTKMQGAGNDFVVLDATRSPFSLDAAQLRRLGDRRFGVGADQILVVEPARSPGVDFAYRIFNGADGSEVEQCGNGARCFVRYVLDKDLATKSPVRVETMNGQLELVAHGDGRVTVDMGRPSGFAIETLDVGGRPVELTLLSMGNPHAVQFVADVDTAPVATVGPLIERHARFPEGVNAGFAQVVARDRLRLRVHERGAGETLACGSGACAAVVAGVCRGLLDARVEVEARGGILTIEWHGSAGRMVEPVSMTGPAETVFEGEIEL